MPTPAEATLIVIVVIVIFVAARLLTLGDALGYFLRNLVGRGETSEPTDSPAEEEKTESGEGSWQSGE